MAMGCRPEPGHLCSLLMAQAGGPDYRPLHGSQLGLELQTSIQVPSTALGPRARNYPGNYMSPLLTTPTSLGCPLSSAHERSCLCLCLSSTSPPCASLLQWCLTTQDQGSWFGHRWHLVEYYLSQSQGMARSCHLSFLLCLHLLLGLMVSEPLVPEASSRLPLDCAPPQEIWRSHLCPVPQFQGHHDMFHLIYSVYFM